MRGRECTIDEETHTDFTAVVCSFFLYITLWMVGCYKVNSSRIKRFNATRKASAQAIPISRLPTKMPEKKAEKGEEIGSWRGLRQR